MITAKLWILTPFHIGTGAGRGRTVDAVVCRNEVGSPYVPASSLKGLARWEATRIRERYPHLAPWVDFCFGTVSEAGRFDFNAAELERTHGGPARRTVGRSKRDRRTGVARDKALFFNEEVESMTLRARIEVPRLESLSPADQRTSILFMFLALRGIRAIGAMRRRGKGKTDTHVHLEAGGLQCFPDGLALPSEDETTRAAFRALLDPAQSPPPAVSALPRASTGTRRDSQSRSCPAPEIAGLCVLADTHGPLTISYSQGMNNIVPSLSHVPGTTVRGGFAHWLLAHGWKPDDTNFIDGFLREQLRFGPWYVTSTAGLMPSPMPKSLRTCKHEPGFARAGSSHRHGVVDRLVHPAQRGCDRCHPSAPLTALEGSLHVIRARGTTSFEQCEARLGTQQRTAIHDHTGRGDDGALYATETIAPGTHFAGYIWGPPALLDAIEAVVPQDGLTLRLGKARSRGHGQVEVTLSGGRARQAGYPRLYTPDATPDRDGFTLTLYSDAVWWDEWLRPITELTAGDLWWLLTGNRAGSPFVNAGSFCGHRTVAAFNGIPRLPRSTEVATEAGSTWRFAWTQTSTVAERAAARAHLLRAHREGLGGRLGEGFGRVMLDFPVHGMALNELQSAGATTGEDPTGEYPDVEHPSTSALGQTFNWLPSGRSPARCASAVRFVGAQAPPKELKRLHGQIRSAIVHNRLGAARALRALVRASDFEKRLMNLLVGHQATRKPRASQCTLETLVTAARRDIDHEGDAPADRYRSPPDADTIERLREVLETTADYLARALEPAS